MDIGFTANEQVPFTDIRRGIRSKSLLHIDQTLRLYANDRATFRGRLRSSGYREITITLERSNAMATRRSAVVSSPVSHSAAVSVVLEKIRALREDIPGFTQPQNRAAAQRLIANASLPDDLLETVSVAIQSSPALASASNVKAEDVRDTIRFAAAYGAVADEAEAFARAVRHTINVRRAETAQACLVVYDLAKGLARKVEGADLVPHILDIRKTIKRGGRRKVAAKVVAKPAEV